MNSKKLKLPVFACVLALSPLLAGADEAAPEEASDFSLSGYIDSSYYYLTGSGTFTSGVPTRAFDRKRENRFDLQTFAVTASYLPKQGLGGLLDLNFGNDADVIAPFHTPANDQFDIQAGYLQYATGPFTAIAGKFVTLAGAEVIKSPSDVNFSRSILFGYAIPFSHTGARLSYALNDKMSFMIGLNKGWDVLQDNNSSNTMELGASLGLADSFTLFLDAYSGKEPGNTGIQGTRNLIDMVGTYTVSDALSLVLNYDYAKQSDAIDAGQDATWSGLAAYANYKFNDKWRLSLRGEYFDDKDGYRTGVAQKWKEATLTLAYLPNESLEFRGEVRADKSDKNAFLNTDGTTDSTQRSFGIEALIKF
ncbi:MAG: porin [Gammaproteobacteria bacterium]|nr:porin [Gammaproteobacteria bacterium]